MIRAKPEVVVSGIDESTFKSENGHSHVLALAEAKASLVATGATDAIVVGCDSMLEFDGTVVGKPESATEALERWQRMRGGRGTLITGHYVVDSANGRWASGVAATDVQFGMPTDDELKAYVVTGEPLNVAGAFTLDGRSAPFVDSVVGDPGNVIGISLPLLRKLLHRIDVAIVDLWH